MSILFSPIVIRGTKIKNRCWVSPMCQYSSKEGLANDWHLVHLGTRAVGGAGLVMTEAAAVSLEGRISPSDLGIWDDKHIEPLKKITNFLMAHDAIPAIQIAHSGRKGSTKKPWENFKNSIDVDEGGWIPIGPSAIPFDGNSVTPNEMSLEDIDRICYFAGFVKGVAYKMGIPIRWGGDWNNNNDLKDNNFDDLPHFELRSF